MGRSGRKPRTKMDPKSAADGTSPKKKEKDWSFEDIARSKTRRR